MTNRQWLIWQMIDMADDVLLRTFAGWSCDVCQMFVRRADGPCPPDHCDDAIIEWLKQEHEDNEND